MSLSSSYSSQEIMKTLEVVGEIFQEDNIKICAKESVKGGLITGVSTLLGGLLGGKTGLLVGKVKSLTICFIFHSLLKKKLVI